MEIDNLSLTHFTNWKNEKYIVYASNSVKNKQLLCYINGNISVKHNEKIVWSGVRPTAAIEFYNNI